MLVELIMDILKGLFLFIVDLIPLLDKVVLPLGFLNWFNNILYTTAFIFPVADLLIMLSIWIATRNFHVIWRVLQRIWDALPFKFS